MAKRLETSLVITKYYQARDLLDEILEDDSKTNRTAPVDGIRAGDIYVYKVIDGEKSLFWRTDGYRWDHQGVEKCPRENAEMLCFKFQLQSYNAETKSLELKEFFRREYIYAKYQTTRLDSRVIISKWGKFPYVIVVYKGEFDITTAINGPHRSTKALSAKSNARFFNAPGGTSPKTSNVSPKATKGPRVKDSEISETQGEEIQEVVDLEEYSLSITIAGKITQSKLPQHVRTEPRIRDEMKAALERGEKPINFYSKTVVSAALSSNVNPKTHTPASKQQVYNIAKEIAKTKQQDDLYNLYDMSVHTKGFVHLLDLANGLKVILGLSPVLAHVERLYHVNEFMYFYYDTTYAVGDYFVSILSLEHRHFCNKRDGGYPTIFIAAVLHEFTDHCVHKRLFSMAQDLIPSFNSPKTVLVMDREASITKAVRMVNNEVKICYCWRHMRENVTAHGRKYLKDVDELTAAINLLDMLFHTPNMEAYDNYRRRLENEWPEELLLYFQDNIEDDFLASSRWELEKRKLYSSISGVTNNRAESTNATLKSILSNKRADFTRFSYSFFYIQTRQLIEIHNGFNRFGDLILHDEQSAVPASVLIKKHELEQCNTAIDLLQIESLVMDGILPSRLLSSQVQHHLVRESLFLEGEARRIIQQNKLEFMPKWHIYIVEGFQKQYYVVNLGKKSCTCHRKKICSHLLAVMLANNNDVEALKGSYVEAFNLGGLYRAQRPKKTGKKGPPLLRIPRQRAHAGLYTLPAETIHDKLEQTHSKQTTTSFSEDEEISSDSSSDEELFGMSTSIFSQDVTLEISFSELPELNPDVHLDDVLHINGIRLCLCDLKSVAPDLPVDEYYVMTHFHSEADESGNCSPNIISAFLKLSTDDINTVSVSAQSFKLFLTDDYSFGKLNRFGLQYNWNLIQIMLIPYKLEDSSWSLFIIKPAEHRISVLTPTGAFKDKKVLGNLTSYCAKMTKTRKTLWAYDIMSNFKDNYTSIIDSGVAVLSSAAAILLDDIVSPCKDYAEARSRILNFVIGKCVVGNDKSICTACKCKEYAFEGSQNTRLTSQKLVCIKCNSCIHVPCFGASGRDARKISKTFCCQ